MAEDSKFFKSRQKPQEKSTATKVVESALLPVMGGVLRAGQGAAGFIEGVADYSKKEAEKATPPPQAPASTWKDIPKMVWGALTASGADQEKQAVENSRRYQQQVSPLVEAVKKEAHQDYEFGKTEADKIESQLGTGGKIAMKAVEAVPQFLMSGPSPALKMANSAYGLASEIGKEKNATAALPQVIAEAAVKGNSKAANIIQPIVEEVAKKFTGFFSSRKESQPVAIR